MDADEQAHEVAGQRDQLERIRAKAYQLLSQDPSGPGADQARRILSKLPKVNIGRNPEQGLRPEFSGAPKVSGELSGGNFGYELPPTQDESLGIKSGPAEMPLLHRAVANIVGNPRGGREFTRGIDDMVTLGAAGRLAEHDQRLPSFTGIADAAEGIGREFPALKDRATQLAEEARTVNYSPEQERADAIENPNARGYGRVAGSLFPYGAAGQIGRLGLGVGRLAAREAGGGLIREGIGGLLGGSATVPAIAGGQAAVAGENVGEALKRELTNPANYLLGGGTGLLSGLAGGIANTGQTGRDIRLAEKYGATPTPFGGAKGGVFKSPAFEGTEGGAVEQGAASGRAARGVMNAFDEERAGLNREYGAAKSAARDQGLLEGRISTDAVREDAQKLIASERLTAGQKAAIKAEVLDALDRHPGGMTVDDFNDLRAKLGDIFGTSPREAAHPALDTLRQTAKRTVDETEMGPINERYSKGREALSRKHQQLGITEGGRREVAEKQIANLIQRRANDEAPGAGIQEAIGTEDFLKENPRFEPSFDTARLLAARERMGLGISPEAGFYRRMGHTLLHKNLEPIAVGLYRAGPTVGRLNVPLQIAAQFLLNGGSQ